MVQTEARMMGEYVTNGEDVYTDPAIPGDGGVSLDPALAKPLISVRIKNGKQALVVVPDHVLKRRKRNDAPNN
jgi:hypothetical protein